MKDMKYSMLHQMMIRASLALTSMLFLFASCVTETDNADSETNVSSGEKVVVRINANMGDSQPATTRTDASTYKTTLDADGNATLDGEKAIYNLCVATFDANGTRLSYDYFKIDGGATSVTQDVTTTTAATKMVVLANYREGKEDPIYGLSGRFDKATTLTDFKAEKITIAYTASIDAQSINPFGSNCQTTTLPAYKEIDLSGLLPYPNVNPTQTITLTRLVSRIYLKSFKEVLNNEFTGASFTPTSVFMYNYGGLMTLAAGTNTYYSAESGIAANSPNLNSGTITLTTDDTNAITNGTAIPSLTGKYMYYVFPNTTSTPTKLVIKGTYKASSTSTPVTMYYPIRINAAADGAGGGNQDSYDGTTATHDGALLANKTISLDVTIHGAGVLNVGDDILPASVTVNKTVADWTTITPSQTVGKEKEPVAVGMYYYSDGSWGYPVYTDAAQGKHPIGYIFSTTPSTIDKNNGFTHGYAIALTYKKVIYASSDSYAPLTPYNTFKTCYPDKDGYTENQTILHKGALGVVTDADIQNHYPAFWYAMTYGTTAQSNTLYAAPLSSSGWYMPSIGQLMEFAVNCLGVNISGYTNYEGTNEGSLSNNYAFPMSSDFSTLNTKLTAAGGSAISTFSNYQSSTPNTINGVRHNYMFIDSNNTLGFYSWGTMTDTNINVLPVIAF
jgi:hypothetical protein